MRYDDEEDMDSECPWDSNPRVEYASQSLLVIDGLKYRIGTARERRVFRRILRVCDAEEAIPALERLRAGGAFIGAGVVLLMIGLIFGVLGGFSVPAILFILVGAGFVIVGPTSGAANKAAIIEIIEDSQPVARADLI